MKMTVIAAGSWGTALSMVLNDNGHEVTVWARRQEQIDEINATRYNHKYLKDIKIPEAITFTSDLTEALCGAEIVVFSVPTQKIRGVIQDVIQTACINDKTVLVNVAKGIDMESLEIPSEMFAKTFSNNPFVALSGPSHAEEVAQKLPTALVSASKSKEAAELIQEVFSNDYIRIYTNPDVVGVEISGALKNIIAVGAGISDGLGYGDNAKAALITRGINEISALGLKMGAQLGTFRGLAGVGDMIVTCTSMLSRNRRCGILLGQGMAFDEAIASIGMVVEGAYTVKSAYRLKEKYDLEMPIVTELYRVLYDNKNAREAVNHLMTRQKKHEIDEFATMTDQWQ